MRYGQLSLLSESVLDGARERWGVIPPGCEMRIDQELDVIDRMGLSSAFLAVSDVVNAVKSGGGIIGPGRGMSPASVVCYSLGITDVDPLRYGMLFDRFLHMGLARPRPILIDVDAKGEWIARNYLSEHHRWSSQKRKRVIVPQLYDVSGIGELGITRVPELDLIASTMDWIGLNGRAWPKLSELEVDVAAFSNEAEELRYQEDVMLLAQRAGMGANTSDRFRKVMAYRMENEAARSRHLFSDETWNRMWERAGTLWAKSHCVCRVKLEQQVAYVKLLRET